MFIMFIMFIKFIMFVVLVWVSRGGRLVVGERCATLIVRGWRMATTAMALVVASNELIQQVVERIVHTFAPEQVILFGSYAEGRATADSDLDLLVVTSKRLRREQRAARLRGLFRDVPLPVEVITMPREEFEQTRDVIGGIAYPAVRYGRVVYEKP